MTSDDALFRRLRLAKRADLVGLLSDLKLDATKNRDKTDAELVDLISAQLRSAAGNSFVNVTRKPHAFPYKQILVDVADKLAPGRFSWTSFKASGPETEEQLEDYIEDRINIRLAEILASMSEADKAKLEERLKADLKAKGVPEQSARAALSALSAGTLSGAALGPLVATMLFGGLWSAVFGLSLAQLLLGGLAVGGPVGIVISAAVVASGASYSKTIPAVHRLIMIRRSAEQRKQLVSSR